MSNGAAAGASATAAIAQAIRASGVIVKVEPSEFRTDTRATARLTRYHGSRRFFRHEIPIPDKLQRLGVLLPVRHTFELAER